MFVIIHLLLFHWSIFESNVPKRGTLKLRLQLYIFFFFFEISFWLRSQSVKTHWSTNNSFLFQIERFLTGSCRPLPHEKKWVARLFKSPPIDFHRKARGNIVSIILMYCCFGIFFFHLLAKQAFEMNPALTYRCGMCYIKCKQLIV